MISKLKKLLSSCTPSGLLAVGFCIYILLTGSAALPGFLSNIRTFTQEKPSLRSCIRQINDQYEDMLSMEQDTPEFLSKRSYINVNGLFARILQQPQMNQRVLLDNGLLVSLSPDGPKEADVRSAAENLIRFCDTHRENGGQFLFIMAPSKISKYEEVLPAGYTDSDNQTADLLLSLLKDGNVPLLDLRQTIRDTGAPWEDAFYITDHHWTVQTGFLAFRTITERLAEIGAAAPVDPYFTDVSNYRFQTFENVFLGSDGKRTGLYFADTDDFTFISPDFPTDIALTIPSREVQIQGSYQEVSYYQDSDLDLSNPDYFNENLYGLYGHGDTPLTQWRNDSAFSVHRLLLIGDSFGNIPFSLLPLCYSSCDEMDMRYYPEDFPQYYRNYQPQTVVLLISPDHCVSDFTCHPYLAEANET